MEKPVYNIHIDKILSYTDADLIDIISSGICEIGYWACIDNSRSEWRDAHGELPKGSTIEDIILHILKKGQGIVLIDAEDDEEFWTLKLDDLLRGIKMTIQSGEWDGEMGGIDGVVGDAIFQYALFNEVVFG